MCAWRAFRSDGGESWTTGTCGWGRRHVSGELAAYLGRTGATQATRGLRVPAGSVEGVSGVLTERLGNAGGDEVLRVRSGYVSIGRTVDMGCTRTQVVSYEKT